MDNVSLIQICATGFSEQDIEIAKGLLFQAIPNAKRMVVRKSKEKTARNLEDIIGLFKSTEPDLIPTFVARDLYKLPPICFDHVDVTRLLKDILIIKNELQFVKTHYTTIEQFVSLKNQFEQQNENRNNFVGSNISEHNYVNMRRGAFLMNSYIGDSGPMGMASFPEEQATEEHVSNHTNYRKIVLSNIDSLPKYKAGENSLADVDASIRQRNDSPLSSPRRVEAPAAATAVPTNELQSACAGEGRTRTRSTASVSEMQGSIEEPETQSQVAQMNELLNNMECKMFADLLQSEDDENSLRENNLEWTEVVYKKKNRNRF